METATRYLATIESLMINSSRLEKELQDTTQGKLPTRAISQEMADQCYHRIASVLGPTAKGTLLDEVTVLCNEFLKVAKLYTEITNTLKLYEKDNKAIEQTVKGNDLEDTYKPTPIVSSVARLRGVLEVTKTRLDRLVSTGNNDVVELRNEVARFLGGDKNE